MAQAGGMSDRLAERYAACRAEVNSRPLSDFWPLEKSKGTLMYNCPICGSGTGANHTGALRLYAPDGQRSAWRVFCFANRCFGDKGTDTLGALRLLNPDLGEWALFRKLGLVRSAPPAEKPVRKASRIDEWAKALPGSRGERYLQSRGFSAETMRAYRLGYDEAHYFGKLGKAVPAVIIPYPGTDYYAARAIEEKAFDKPRSSEAGPEPLFNAGDIAAAAGDAVFVVESQLCALSIRQLGGRAVALGNSGKARLLEAARNLAPGGVLVLALDNDPQTDPEKPEKGPKAQAELAEALREKDIPFLQYNIAGSAKDPNEALQRDPAGLKREIEEARSVARAWMESRGERLKAEEAEAIAAAEMDQEARRLDYAGQSAAGQLQDMRREIEDSSAYPPVTTGFMGLDEMLDGGFYPGLYILGDISSLGKTSFILQVADQMAAAGQDVLFFSLEMNRYELMAKSISRLTWQLSQAKRLGRGTAKTTRGILTGKRYERYRPQELSLIDEARNAYADFAGHLWFVEGVGDVSAAMIRERVEQHIAATGRSPAVIVDYLQILTPVDIRATDKQNTDRNVLELKRLSRDKRIPVIGISSLNRENYTQPINMTAYKEAGSIEYGSDCLMGLQYEGMDYREGENEKAREKRVRDLLKANEGLARDGKAVQLQLKILKNRNGIRGVSAPLFYTPMFNAFEEGSEGFQTVQDPDDPFGGAASVRLGQKRLR